MDTKKEILLVEDNKEHQIILKNQLSKHIQNIVFTVIGDENELREHLLTKKTDLVISDYYLKGFTGLKALEIVRKINKDIPFIMISGALGEEQAADIMLQGASDFVLKNNIKRLIPAAKRELQNYSELKKNKSLLQKTQTKLDKASRIGNLGYWEWNIEKNKLWWSQTVSSIFGIEHISEQTISSFIELFQYNNNDEIVDELIQFVINSKKATDVELKIHTINNIEKWIRIDAEPIIVNDEVKQIFGSIKEITSIRESELKLSNLANNLPGAVMQYRQFSDGTDSIEFLSDSAADLWGIDPDRALKDSSVIWNLVHKQDVDSVIKSVQSSAESLKQWEAKWRINHPSGEVHWHEGRGIPRRLPDGSTVWDTIIFDITDKEKLHQELEYSEQRFKSIVKEGTDPIAVLDKNGTCISQLSLGKLFTGTGIPEQHYVGKNLFEYIHEEDREPLLHQLKTIEPGQRYEVGPFRFKYPDGSWIWLETTAINLLHNSIIEGIVITSRDVTERINRKKEVEKLSTVASKTTDTIIITDTDDKITWVNDAFEKLTGFNIEESIGREVGLLLRGKATDKDSIKRIASAQEERKPFREEILNYSKSGEKIWVSITGDPIYDEKGEFKGYIAIQRDVTEKRARVQKLKKTLKEKDVLLSEVHHRVKNNLAIISGLMQLQAFAEEDGKMQIKLNKNVIRIQTMAMTHEVLYQSDSFSEIYLDEQHFERIINTIVQDIDADLNIQFDLNINSIGLNINQALPFSMVFSEVISRICSYNLKTSDNSSFTVEISEGEKLEFKIINKNAEISTNLWNDISSTDKFELTLIETFCSQLNGTFSIAPDQDDILFQLSFVKKETRGPVSNIIG